MTNTSINKDTELSRLKIILNDIFNNDVKTMNDFIIKSYNDKVAIIHKTTQAYDLVNKSD